MLESYRMQRADPPATHPEGMPGGLLFIPLVFTVPESSSVFFQDGNQHHLV